LVEGLARDRPRLPEVAGHLIAAVVSLAGVLGAPAVEVGDLIWWPWQRQRLFTFCQRAPPWRLR
jgi:hypothetical protein